jgi:hypothetical protein
MGWSRRGSRPHDRALALIGCGVLATALGVGLTACTEASDLARSAQTQLGRIDEVAQVEVSAPTWDHDARIVLTYTDVADADALARLIDRVDEIAAGQHYSAYTLTLSADGADDQLTVDERVADMTGEKTALGAWFTVSEKMLGKVAYDLEPNWESITVVSGGGIAHDIAAARQTGYGGPATTWRFENGPSAFVATGAVTADDVELFQDVQRSVGSTNLPAVADAWQLDRRDDHVRLDLDVRFPGGAVPPARLTLGSYATTVGPLADAALSALASPDRARFLSLRTTGGDGADDGADDVFATWTSTQDPARGRDLLDRGWDRWLAQRA